VSGEPLVEINEFGKDDQLLEIAIHKGGIHKRLAQKEWSATVSL
jgi:hypothetical protein